MRGCDSTHKAGTVGTVLVIGGGIGGIQSSLDLAESGFTVYLVENDYTLGGVMARLDKTFPTNDCSACMFSPKLSSVARHPRIRILTGSRLVDLQGEPGRFKAVVERRPRYIDQEKCIACGKCAEKCPKKVSDSFNGELAFRKAAYLTFPQAVPLKYALDPENCLYLTRKRCGLCSKVCPTGAVNFEQKADMIEVEAGAVIISTGFEPVLNPSSADYGFGRYKNVVSSLQYERMMSATGPHDGHILRPSDGRPPRSVAWIQCVLSRDASCNRPFCSSVCCMHAMKQAMLTRIHYPETSATIYFMDVRAQGKGFDAFADRGRRDYGVTYRRSMISQLHFNPSNENLVIETFDHKNNCKVEEEFELIVLSSGFKPSGPSSELIEKLGLETNPYGFLTAGFASPVSTSKPGIFVCGGIEAPKDIPETVIQAGAAAAEAAVLLAEARSVDMPETDTVVELPENGPPRVGVFVCHCGTNIAGVVEIPEVMERARAMGNVVHVNDFMFTCSSETLDSLVDQIREHRINRVVVAACSPKTHEPLFREVMKRAGLNPHLFEMANIRNQCSWVHAAHPEKATGKAVQLIRGSVARAEHLEPLLETSYPVMQRALVVGGGVAGMTSALTIADQGFPVHLVESGERLGGFARELTTTLEGDDPSRLVDDLCRRVQAHPDITVHLKSRLIGHAGYAGSFEGAVSLPDGAQVIHYGAAVIATGGQPYQPSEYGYGSDPRIMTQVELARRMQEDRAWVQKLKRVVMIQCVGSRTQEFPFCSRVCCSGAVKNSLTLKEIHPGIQVLVLYRDMRTFGFKELYYLEARKRNVLFFRFNPDEPPSLRDGAKENLTLDFTDRSSGQKFMVQPDLLVLSTGIRPHSGAEHIAGSLKLPRLPEGFFMEAHVKLRPLEFSSPGVFLAGTAHSPRFIPEAIAMAKGAAQQAVKILRRSEMSTPATVAKVNTEVCTACLACVRSCPFGAPFINADGVSEIPAAKCRGCGICAGECPARAITLKHSTDDQIMACIDALATDPGLGG
ncbi:MAG: CoB--CoM heterodisulfide reductase iron-sulfur subunit A family protein [Desulfobacteraceae bacterium]|nr:MAG: CoB--CoM heterodisulfide reductase iron-sulfur subunit A family protein [Desulfobacteraceae bacterium]